MKSFLLAVATLVMVNFGYAQGYDPDKVNKQARTIYDLALERAADAKYYEAIQMLDKAISLDGKFVEASQV